MTLRMTLIVDHYFFKLAQQIEKYHPEKINTWGFIHHNSVLLDLDLLLFTLL